MLPKSPKLVLSKFSTFLCSENIALFYQLIWEGFFVTAVFLTQMILVLVREKVEKNDMFFPHMSLRAEG